MMISMELENLPINLGTATLSNQSPPVGGFKKIIIVGAGRTGTTAITAVIQELGFFTGSSEASLENDELENLLSSQQYSLLLDKLSEMADLHDRVVWKSTKLISNVHEDFVSSLPLDIGIVIMFRDILATAVRNNIVNDIELIQGLTTNIKANRKILQFIQSNQNHKLLISYEKLMTSTPEVAKSIADFCGDIDPALLASAANKITTKPIKYLKTAADFIEKRRKKQ
jgi:hypothetical protein